jgi:putative endonuclease
MKIDHNYFVYIVKCTDGSYYTGVTNDVEIRLQQHNEGYYPRCYTYRRRPVVLVYWQRFQFIEDAISWEKQVKGWNRRKKEALLTEDWTEIQRLASIRYGIVGEAWRKDSPDMTHPSSASG